MTKNSEEIIPNQDFIFIIIEVFFLNFNLIEKTCHSYIDQTPRYWLLGNLYSHLSFLLNGRKMFSHWKAKCWVCDLNVPMMGERERSFSCWKLTRPDLKSEHMTIQWWAHLLMFPHFRFYVQMNRFFFIYLAFTRIIDNRNNIITIIIIIFFFDRIKLERSLLQTI